MTEPSGPHLLTNATVHSTAEPYAEAMIVEDGLVAWVGSAQTAEHLRDDRFLVEDVDAALITPAFFGWVRRPVACSVDELISALDAAAGQGVATVRLVIDSVGRADGEALKTLLDAAAAHPIAVHPVLGLAHGPVASDAAPADHYAEAVVPLMDQLQASDTPPLAVGLPETVWQLSDPLAGVLPSALAAAQAGRQLVLTLPEDVDPGTVVATVQQLRTQLAAGPGTPPADRPTVLYGFDSAEPDHWEQLVGTGVHPVVVGDGFLSLALRIGVPASAAPAPGQSPWALVSALVHREESPVSVRAAFNAQVRGAHRMVSGLPAGQLNPGSAATYALWDVDSLAVQTPDSRTAAWSTDARARTPLLPYLDGETLPRHRRTVIDGHTVIDGRTVSEETDSSAGLST